MRKHDWLIDCCSSCPKKTRQDFTTEQKQLLRNLTHCKWRCAHSPSTSGIVCNSTHHCAVSICNISVYFRVVMKQHFTWTHKFVLFKKKKTAMVASTSNLYLCIKVCLNTWLYLLCKISPSLYSDACRSVCWFSFFRGGGLAPHHTTPHHTTSCSMSLSILNLCVLQPYGKRPTLTPWQQLLLTEL